MPDLAKALKSEIRRLSRSEAKALVAPLVKTLVQFRRQLRSLSRAQLALEQRLAQGGGSAAALPKPDATVLAKGRLGPRLIGKIRNRLGLSRNQFAQLLDVNSNSVFNWEHGKSHPTAALRARLIAARQIGRREARRLLAAKSAETSASAK
ncbi:MAG: helix-turn-helix protein [Lentisphaerae bacterium ADurb.BinA184]|nr:MAG: helix-turn-helix protein [Lentisphaerae bacterium ADurb.BinA184]